MFLLLHMFSILDSCFGRLFRVAKKKLYFVSCLSYSTHFGDTSPLAHPLYLTHNCYISHFKSPLVVSLCIFLVLVINWPNKYPAAEVCRKGLKHQRKREAFSVSSLKNNNSFFVHSITLGGDLHYRRSRTIASRDTVMQ